MINRLFLWTFACAGWIAGVPPTVADEPAQRFSRDVLPLLADRCFHCHGPDAVDRQADLRLDQEQDATSDRDGYHVIDREQPLESELWTRITSDDPDLVMPPADSNREPLTDDERQTLKRWLMAGAPWGRHWSFERPKRSRPPAVWGADHPIDAFIRHRLQQEGLTPNGEASRETLIRRVTLDLTGLPPTPQEVDAFLADKSPQAYERLVDRLLNSPHYGERMAWPWLDAARYADTGGYQGDPDRTMWPWRDWVVDAMNANMPFDRFTIEQLAGDLLPEPTPAQRLATGFNRNHMHNSEGGRIAEETRVENVFDRAETTATVWLGMTLQCARCHDHKFDPTTNHDYFAFFDFFNQTSEDGRTDRSAAVPPSMDYVTRQARSAIADLDRRIAAAKKRLLDPAKQADAASLAELERERAEWKSRAKPVKVMVMDTRSELRDTFVLVKGIYNDVTDTSVSADVPSMLPKLNVPEGRRPNRLDLARWLVDPANPLTARVTVNRYWQTFFGRGIVPTPGDFGLQGTQPSHPDLLDWLAVEFVESGWDVKRMHRMIVCSDTYRQSAVITPELGEADPQNILLARAPRFRLPSWMIRDQALAASGLLDTRLGGPPVRPYQPSGVWAEATFGKKRYEPDSGSNLYRRSLYTFWRRIIGPTMFFDAAKRQTCEVQTNRTNTPLHALTTLNDVTYVEAARVLAQQLQQRNVSKEERIGAAFRRVMARWPEERELQLLGKRWDEYVKEFTRHPEDARKLLSVGASPRDESLDAAQHAAYTTLINTLLNLDEALVKP